MAENTPTLGEFLRQERERRGITIEQVASATKISVRLLHSLETDHYADLPAKPFVRGFVNSYARFIGLDSKDLLTKFGNFIEDKAHDRPTKEAGHSGYAFEKREGEQSRTVLWFVMGGFLTVGGIVMIFLKPSLHHHRGSHVDKLKEAHSEVSSSPGPAASLAAAASLVVASPTPGTASPTPTSGAAVIAAVPSPSPVPSPPRPSPSPFASPSPSPSPVAAPVEKPSPGPTVEPSALPDDEEGSKDPLNSGVDLKASAIKEKIIFKALGTTLIRYKVDEKPVMKFILKKDKVLVLRAKNIVRFQAANPKAIVFNANGKGYKSFGNDKALTIHEGSSTLIFPVEAPESIQEPFPGEPPLTPRGIGESTRPAEQKAN